jgi:hypothetical protein
MANGVPAMIVLRDLIIAGRSLTRARGLSLTVIIMPSLTELELRVMATGARAYSPQSAIPITCLIVLGSSTARSMKSATSAREIDNPRRTFCPNAIL